MVANRFAFLFTVTLIGCSPVAAETPGASKKSEKPRWSVRGQVVDSDGVPMPDVTITVSTGIGTLSGGGKGTTDQDGKFDVTFGPGIQMANNDVQLQYATVYADRPGFFEKDLCRHGGLAMALRIPDDFEGWGGRKKEDIILPGEPRELNFRLLPATNCSGTVVDENGKPMPGCKVSLKGEDMPPSSSVAASASADEQGRFHLESIPTGFEYQILVRPSNPAPPWNAWASGKLKFAIGDAQAAATFTHGENQIETSRFEIQVKTSGVNWKRALQIGDAHQSIVRDGDSVRLELHPPGLPLAKMFLPKSVKLSLGRLPANGQLPASSDASFTAAIDPSLSRESLSVPDDVRWDFARVKQIRTKFRGTSLDLWADIELVVQADQNGHVLIAVKGLDESGNVAYDNWRVVSDKKRMRSIEIPRVTLSDIRAIDIGIRPLTDDEVETFPETRSRTDLRITSRDGEGGFIVRFENPDNEYAGGRIQLDPEKHQVIFQVHGQDASGKTLPTVLRQLKAQEQGGYQEQIMIRPELFAHSRISITFVTIQPNHDQWVQDFFVHGKGTSYSGMWLSDVAPLRKLAVAPDD